MQHNPTPGISKAKGEGSISNPQAKHAAVRPSGPGVGRIVRGLLQEYPDVRCALNYDSPFQLLVATILSAQCTDVRVNIVTKKLFAEYPDAQAIADLHLKRLQKLIQTTGFFRNKARNIRACARTLIKEFDGDVPRDFERLTALPGVGRKTANVVMGTAFGIASGVVVDTHVARISRRLGMTEHEDPVKIEQDLMAQLPQKEWIMFSHRMIHHGRRVCKARKPRCEECMLAKLCPRVGLSG